MEGFNGLIKIGSQELTRLCDITIIRIKEEREKLKTEWIEHIKEKYRKPQWFGLLKGKEITDEEALEILEDTAAGDISFLFKYKYENVMNMSKELLVAATSNTHHDIYITTKIYSVLKNWCK